MFYVYKIFNTLNGKVYIGKTNKPSKRWVDHKRYAAGGKSKYPKLFSIVHSSISKYGSNNFEFIVIQNFQSEKEAYEAEIYWINFYNSRDSKFGYNISKGGFGDSSGKDSHNFGLKRSAETILKLRSSHLGEKNSNFNKVFSEETLQKMSSSQKGNQKGESHGRSVLTEDLVRNLRIDYKTGEYTIVELSKKYKINLSTTKAVVHLYSWKHVII